METQAVPQVSFKIESQSGNFEHVLKIPPTSIQGTGDVSTIMRSIVAHQRRRWLRGDTLRRRGPRRRAGLAFCRRPDTLALGGGSGKKPDLIVISDEPLHPTALAFVVTS
jgi:hypothetical protein